MDHEKLKAEVHAVIQGTTSYRDLLGMLEILVRTSLNGSHPPEFFIEELSVLSAQFQRLFNTGTMEK